MRASVLRPRGAKVQVASGPGGQPGLEIITLPLAGTLAHLKATANGLNAVEVERRLAQYGPNQIEQQGGPSLFKAYLARLRNPLILVLIAAAAISAITGDTPSLLIIISILVLSITLDVVQEHRAQIAAQQLREQVTLTARTIREGMAIDIPARQLVPGDVILVSAGDLVPADCRLLQAQDLYVNEALLTGEAYPAEKQATDESGSGLLPRNCVFMGSSVLSGSARALVVATGHDAQLGGIATALLKVAPDTAFASGIHDFGRLILRLTIMLVLFALLINLLLHRPPLQSFLFALALAVGLTPELLPMVMSVTLANGAIRLSRKGVIVKRLTAIHDLGSMDVFCSDKTGTLTEAKITLTAAATLDGKEDPSILNAAALNAAFETGIKSPLDAAILAAAKTDLSGWEKIDEAPFDFERRRVSVLVAGKDSRRIIVKGAPEDVLLLCADYIASDHGKTLRPLDDAARRTARDTIMAFGGQGYRVLAVASLDADQSRASAALVTGETLIFLGFLAFEDPPKSGAGATLASLNALGVAVKIVTGDSEAVTRHVCAALGLAVAGCLTGMELAGLSDEALSGRLEQTTLFCRVTPPQKSRVIAALRRKGHVVGYLGDGINDAPSLRAADVGFSVDTGVDVAKEAACMILLRKDLDVIAEGVREGRRTYANILKYVMMGTSSNFGNMFSMAGGALLLPFLPMLPIQILLNNLLYDLSETTIPLDHVEEELLAKPRRWDISVIRKFMILLGPVSSVFDFITFWLLLNFFGAQQVIFHTGWFVESMATQVFVIFIIRSAHPWRNKPHPALVISSAIAVGIATVIPYSPVGRWFGFAPLQMTLLGALALTTVAYLATIYAVRRWFFARYELM